MAVEHDGSVRQKTKERYTDRLLVHKEDIEWCERCERVDYACRRRNNLGEPKKNSEEQIP